jgi:hypothetical protein
VTEISLFAPQMRMIDLLDDKTFKEFFRTKPKVPPHLQGQECWRVFVQREAGGKWAKRDFDSYPAAANFAISLLRKGAWDLAVHCRSVSYGPPGRWVNLTKNGKPVYLTDANNKPVLRGGQKVRKQRFVAMHVPPGHVWCPHCRRPTIFRWFRSHHAFPKSRPEVAYDPSHLRCTICGIRESSVNWRGGSK